MSFFNKLTYQNPEKDKFKAQLGVILWKETGEGGQDLKSILE
jgi:hypothetical protein